MFLDIYRFCHTTVNQNIYMKGEKYIPLIFLIVAIALGIATRYYKLGEAPAGLYLDEAGQGYSAYSILKTGKDEFGKAYPFVFRSFTDFKTPVYIYMLVPLIPIFGLTKFTIRFPSFFFSILTLPLIYYLLAKITPKKYAQPLAILTTMLLAISPWHILFGRTNFECNVALFFFLAGVYFFYEGLKKPKRLLISALAFAVAIPAYHSQRIITPLIMLVLFIKHRKILLGESHKKYLLSGMLLGFLISIPTISVMFTPGFLARAGGLNIFNFARQLPAGYISSYGGIFAFIVNNNIFLSIREFLALYISYLSPRNMFILGDYGPRSSFPELSTFFVWQFPFYIYGLYILFKNKKLKELRFFTIALFLISPIPAAVTRDPYSTIRALPLVIPQLIIISLGIVETIRLIKPKLFKTIAYCLMPIALIYSLAQLYSSVIVLNEYYRAKYWNYGWEEVVENINNLDANLPITVDIARNEPYIQLLFFLKHDPATYQKENFEVSPDEYYSNMTRINERKVGNIITRHIDWKRDLAIEQYLIGDALAISDNQILEHNMELISEVIYPDESVAFRIVRTSLSGVRTSPSGAITSP